MANVTIEGKLWIDLASICAWLESRGTPTEGVSRIRFDVICDALVAEFDGGKEQVETDAAKFWEWVVDKHLPKGINYFETAFGVPRTEDGCLVITFAAGSDNNPRDWGVPPACLGEWKQLEALAV